MYWGVMVCHKDKDVCGSCLIQSGEILLTRNPRSLRGSDGDRYHNTEGEQRRDNQPSLPGMHMNVRLLDSKGCQS